MATENASLPNMEKCQCECCLSNKMRRNGKSRRRTAGRKRRKAVKDNFLKNMKLDGTNYDLITSVEYLNEKYGLKKAHYIEKFICCIHKKINVDTQNISDEFVDNLSLWVKVKLFLLLVTLSQRGGPEYWLEKSDHDLKTTTDLDVEKSTLNSNEELSSGKNTKSATNKGYKNLKEHDSAKANKTILTLTEQIMRNNIKQDFLESTYNENYVFSSIWANFMEGLINHYLEKIIIPKSEMKVCQQLYKPMMKIISLYNEYNELIEKSERNGFLLPLKEEEQPVPEPATSVTSLDVNQDDVVTKERLQKAQKLLWQARQDIPKTISKELTLLSEMYSTLSADEQDYELDEFVSCAEEYIELEFLPCLINLLFINCGTKHFWKIMIVLEPFFYYIEDADDDEENEHVDEASQTSDVVYDVGSTQSFKPDPRVITLEKICEVAARQKWI